MRPEHQRAWVQQAQADAERGVIECRMCRCRAGLDEATTLWRSGMLVFALCDRCAARPGCGALAHHGGCRGARLPPSTDPCRGWTVKIIASAKRPCHLERGEVRRVPQDRISRLVGYHVCCPRCGFNTPALAGSGGFDITEGDEPADLTFSRALRCTLCRVLLHVSHGEVRLEEDADVRNVRYR